MSKLSRICLTLLPIGAFSSFLALPAEATVPPPTPNVCAIHFCAEIFPILSADGFTAPEFEISANARSSAILARFEGHGSVLLRNEIVDGSFCESRVLGIKRVTEGNLEGYFELPPSPERAGNTQCRFFSASSLNNPDLMSQLRIIWFTADYIVGTNNGQFARNVELRIDVSEHP